MKPEKPLVISKAEEIFGGSAKVSNCNWVEFYEGLGRLIFLSQETLPFSWRKNGDQWYAQIKGRPESKCPNCDRIVYKGVSNNGKQISVDSGGRSHFCV